MNDRSRLIREAADKLSDLAVEYQFDMEILGWFGLVLDTVRKHADLLDAGTEPDLLTQADYDVVSEAWKQFAKNSAGIGEAIPVLMSSASILNHLFDKVLPRLIDQRSDMRISQ